MHLHLLLLLLPLASSCPGEAWVAAGSSCYLSSSTSMSWWAALEYCELEGGYLVEVDTAAEQDLVTGMFGSGEYHWIGLTDLATPGHYKWRHSHQAPTYTNWGPSQPDSGDQHCVFLWGTHGGQWADYLCQESASSGGRPVKALCEAPSASSPPLKVLWLGNSYTYYNDLPGMVSQLAAAEGRAVAYSNHTEGGWTWKKHAESKVTLDMIKSEAWDVVVLQEQSRAPAFPADRVCEDTLPYLATLVAAIREASPAAVLQFYLTWGRPFGYAADCPTYPQFCDFPSMQAALTTSYRAFACQNPPARVAAVGEGFATFWDTDRFLSLYKDDGDDHHPSLAGSYLSAASHYAAMFDASPVGSSYTGGLDTATARSLQETAHTVWQGGDWSFPDSNCADCLCHCSHV